MKKTGCYRIQYWKIKRIVALYETIPLAFPPKGIVHLFCLKKYTNSKSGILHISITADGTIEQQDIIADAHFNYRLNAARQLQPGLLLVPYVYRSKTGLMQLSY